MLVHHGVDYHSEVRGESLCVITDEEQLSYKECNEQVNRLAHGLIELGVYKGDRVAVLGKNSAKHLVLFLAAGKIGAVSVPLNYRLTPHELSYVISDSCAKVVLATDRDSQAVLETLLPELGDGIKLIGVEAGENGASLALGPWRDGQPCTPPEVLVNEGDDFLQIYTSGTTGNPKGVVITHKAMTKAVVTLCGDLGVAPGASGKELLVAPLFHIGGIGNLLKSVIYGDCVVLIHAFDPFDVIKKIVEHSINTVFLVPAMIQAILATVPDLDKQDFSQLKRIIYGASPITHTLLEKALAVFKCDFWQTYGMTETCGNIVMLTNVDHVRALQGRPELLQSCGRPATGVQVKIFDGEGKELPRGVTGEIAVQCDYLLKSYWKLPEASEAIFIDGWLRTGDSAYMDDEGYIYMRDRIKDMIITGGENVYPVEVENVLSKHPAVLEAAVIGIPDEKYGEALLAVCVLQKSKTLEVEELIEFCRDKIAGYKIPRRLVVVDSLPRNPTGKLLKYKLRENYRPKDQQSLVQL